MNWVLIFILSVAVAMATEQGSVKLRVSQKGIDTVKFLAVALIEEESKEYRFPDLDQTTSNVAYDTNYKFDKMTLNDLKFNETSLTLSKPNTVVFNAARADGNMNGNYNATGIPKIRILPNTNRHGQFKASLVVREISAAISMEEISGSFRTSVVNCTVGSASITLNEKQSTESGQLGTQELKTIGKGYIESHITEKICLGLSSQLTSKLNSLIGGFEEQPIDILGVSIDLDLVNQPKVIKVNNTDCYVEAEIDGKCFPLSNPEIKYNIAREMLPDFPPSNAMVQLILGNYVLETLLHSVYETGLFNQTIDFDNFDLGGLPIPIKFNARFISTVAPGLSKFGFEGSEPLRVKLEASKSPSINLTPGGIDVEGAFIISILIVNDSRANVTGTDRNAVFAFSLSVNINVSGSIAIKDDSKIVPRLNKLDFSLKILNDEPVNGVDLNPINFMLSVAKPTLLSTINDLFKDGIAIPAAFGFSLTKLEFSTVNKAAIIGADVGVNKNYDLQGLFEAIEDIN